MTPLPLVAGALLGLLLACPSTAARADERAAPAAPAEQFELRDGDRVVLIGNTFIEREQAYSYLETLLRSRWPERQVVFRNLGWSGDTVFGHARSYFDPPEKGFERLDKIVHELKPTVIFIGYGMAESFDGEAGLPAFRQGFERLLDMLKDLKARETVLLGPIQHEKLARHPSPSDHNKWIRAYADVVKAVGDERGHRFLDLFDVTKPDASVRDGPYTENGIHLSAYGYWRAAGMVEEKLGLPDRGWTVTLGPGDQHQVSGEGIRASHVESIGDGGYRVKVTAIAPAPKSPPKSIGQVLPQSFRHIRVRGAKAGTYALLINGRLVKKRMTRGGRTTFILVDEPLLETAEKVRQLSVQKNLQYVNQWRPANDTYIFGFRAHEQGKNAAEMPQFDEPIAKLEAKITTLVQPVEVTYELKAE